MCVHWFTKFQVSSIIVTSFRQGNNPPCPIVIAKRAPKKPTQIRARILQFSLRDLTTKGNGLLWRSKLFCQLLLTNRLKVIDFLKRIHIIITNNWELIIIMIIKIIIESLLSLYNYDNYCKLVANLKYFVSDLLTCCMVAQVLQNSVSMCLVLVYSVSSYLYSVLSYSYSVLTCLKISHA